jgi:hypothetical protein
MQPNIQKKYIILSFGVACAMLVLQAILFWNVTPKEVKQSHGLWTFLWPFLLLIIALLALGYMFSIFLKTTNPELIESTINKKIAIEKAKIIEEFQKKNETEEKQEDIESIIDNKAKELVPKGNFKNIDSLIEKYLKNLAAEFEIVQGIVYLKATEKEEYEFSSGFALTADQKPDSFKPGETLAGQVAISKSITYLNDIPDQYFSVISGLGQSKPKALTLIPLLNENDVIAIIEVATFKAFEGNAQKILERSQLNISTKLTQTIKS